MTESSAIILIVVLGILLLFSAYLFRDGNGIHGIFAGENEKSRAKKEER